MDFFHKIKDITSWRENDFFSKKPFEISKDQAMDRRFLRNMLYEAIFVPERQKAFSKSIINLPELSRYFEEWGRPGDFGIVAINNGRRVGAVWCRQFEVNSKGFGFVDGHTPELTIALKRKYRDRGIGTGLMREMLAFAREKGYKAISLSVDTRNRATDLYIREGFEIVERQEYSMTMKRVL